MPATIGRNEIGPLHEVLTESVEEVKQREASALSHLLKQHEGRCVLYGAGTLGRKAVVLLREAGAEVLAVTDADSRRWGTGIEGVQVLSPEDAARRFGENSVFFVTVWNDFHWFSDTRRKLTALGCKTVSSYAPIFWKFGERFLHMLLLNEPPQRLYADRERVLEGETIWADKESLDTYRANIVWRALGDPSYLPFPPPANTYFPADIFRILPDESVVDCGAFDGDTLRLLISVAGERFGAFYAIEADQVSLGKLRSYIASLPPELARKVHELPYAVGAERCTLKFAMSGAATSKSGFDEGVEVDCVPIDELFADTRTTLIKMDIEGAEFDALRGARKVIERDRPVLAVCVYHTQNDVWRLPLLMREFNPDYRLYLRAYDGDGLQSVVYAVPPERVSDRP